MQATPNSNPSWIESDNKSLTYDFNVYTRYVILQDEDQFKFNVRRETQNFIAKHETHKLSKTNLRFT